MRVRTFLLIFVFSIARASVSAAAEEEDSAVDFVEEVRELCTAVARKYAEIHRVSSIDAERELRHWLELPYEDLAKRVNYFATFLILANGLAILTGEKLIASVEHIFRLRKMPIPKLFSRLLLVHFRDGRNPFMIPLCEFLPVAAGVEPPKKKLFQKAVYAAMKNLPEGWISEKLRPLLKKGDGDEIAERLYSELLQTRSSAKLRAHEKSFSLKKFSIIPAAIGAVGTGLMHFVKSEKFTDMTIGGATAVLKGTSDPQSQAVRAMRFFIGELLKMDDRQQKMVINLLVRFALRNYRPTAAITPREVIVTAVKLGAENFHELFCKDEKTKKNFGQLLIGFLESFRIGNATILSGHP